MEDENPSKRVKTNEQGKQNFPSAFIRFLEENNIDPKVYDNIDNLPRYIRTHPKYKLTQKELEESLKTKVEPILWIPNFYKLDANVKIADTDLYKEGKIYGIDLSSGAAVVALGVQPNDHCLDLCCAPGAKLCYIANLLGEETEGSVTGVDISEQRLSSCKTVCTKYKIPNVRLFLEDGTTFNNLAPSKEKSKEEEVKEVPNENSIPLNKRGKRKKKKKKKVKIQGLFFESEGIKSFGNLNSQQYDKVLVDAECTHDGSVKHIAKYDKLWGWETFEKRFMDNERIQTITTLQKNLLTNGFKLLKAGGTIVYSTCSFSRKQNEEVIAWFLEQEPLAEIVALNEANWPIQQNKEKDERLAKLVRFDPISSGTGGLFICKMMKKVV